MLGNLIFGLTIIIKLLQTIGLRIFLRTLFNNISDEYDEGSPQRMRQSASDRFRPSPQITDITGKTNDVTQIF